MGSTIVLNWTIPSPKLDITYCVDVINTVNSTTINEGCVSHVSQLNFTVPDGAKCSTFIFVVTATVDLEVIGLDRDLIIEVKERKL